MPSHYLKLITYCKLILTNKPPWNSIKIKKNYFKKMHLKKIVVCPVILFLIQLVLASSSALPTPFRSGRDQLPLKSKSLHVAVTAGTGGCHYDNHLRWHCWKTRDGLMLKRKCGHFDEIFITGCTGNCQNDNFKCSQWWRKFRQNEKEILITGCTGNCQNNNIQCSQRWKFRIMTTFPFQ